MKYAYPVILTPDGGGYVAYFPDFNSGTQGESLADAIDMSADAIGLLGITMLDEGDKIPAP
ncbi:MAG: type II toxin-antitoxin system HicB family antitoxin, partial [Oscillibacter sp.]|nr:type II toxin-antitoxin system HicB family antitoxin [Oscillibacter sp.]